MGRPSRLVLAEGSASQAFAVTNPTRGWGIPLTRARARRYAFTKIGPLCVVVRTRRRHRGTHRRRPGTRRHHPGTRRRHRGTHRRRRGTRRRHPGTRRRHRGTHRRRRGTRRRHPGTRRRHRGTHHAQLLLFEVEALDRYIGLLGHAQPALIVQPILASQLDSFQGGRSVHRTRHLSAAP